MKATTIFPTAWGLKRTKRTNKGLNSQSHNDIPHRLGTETSTPEERAAARW